MKGRDLIISSILVLAVGIVLLIFRNSINRDALVILGGICFIVAGILNIILFLNRHDETDGKPRQGYWANALGKGVSIGAVLLGLAMIIFHSNFVILVTFVFGIIIAAAAVYQLYIMFTEGRGGRLPVWLYAAPILLACGSIYILVKSNDNPESTLMIISGCCALVFGAAQLIEGIIIGKDNHKELKETRLEGKKTSGSTSVPATPSEPKSLDDAQK